MIKFFIFISAFFLLTLAAYYIFRIVVRNDYKHKGKLTMLSSFMELLIWGLFIGFPYLYLPPEWIWFLSPDVPVNSTLRMIGIICIFSGLILAFGTMFWFGLRRAFGLQVSSLVQTGPYRLSRNPQIVTGTLMIVGTIILWPSWYALGWIILFAVIAHLMVITEEEHLLSIFGKTYENYCRQVPRYIG